MQLLDSQLHLSYDATLAGGGFVLFWPFNGTQSSYAVNDLLDVRSDAEILLLGPVATGLDGGSVALGELSDGFQLVDEEGYSLNVTGAAGASGADRTFSGLVLGAFSPGVMEFHAELIVDANLTAGQMPLIATLSDVELQRTRGESTDGFITMTVQDQPDGFSHFQVLTPDNRLRHYRHMFSNGYLAEGNLVMNGITPVCDLPAYAGTMVSEAGETSSTIVRGEAVEIVHVGAAWDDRPDGWPTFSSGYVEPVRAGTCDDGPPSAVVLGTG